MDKKLKYGYSVSLLAIAVNIILFVLKLWVGNLSNSLAIIADAWHTLSDSITSIIIIIGIKFSLKPADKKHPFGHGRIEFVTSLVIAVLLVVVAFHFISKGINRISFHESITYGKLALIVIIISIIFKELLAQYSFWVGRKIDSKSIIADGWHHRSDSLSSIIILIGIFFSDKFWWIDGVLSIVVSIFILYGAYKIVKSIIDSFLGEAPEKDLTDKVKQIANSIYDKKLDLHHFHIHKYGKHTELTFHLKLPAKMTLAESHKIVLMIEKRIRSKLNIEPTIHVDPVKPTRI